MKKDRVCPVEKAGSLEIWIRKLLQNPKRMLNKYIREGMTILDYGCGPGFFTTEMARMAGESGKVIAADLQQGMLDKLKERIEGTEIEKRIRLHRCEEERIGISEKVDFVLAFYLFHELPDQEKALREIRSVLKPGGLFYMAEPKYFHVSKEEFEESVKKATRIGFGIVGRPRVFLTRAVVLRK